MLMYSDHLQNRLDFGHGMLIFLILAPFWLSETGQIWDFRDFLQNAWEEWPKIWHADLSWPPLGPTLGSWSIDFPHFGAILTEWNRSNVQFPGIFVTMYGKNGPKFVMLISILWYPQKWKRQILVHENNPVTEQGVSKLLCGQTF